MKTTEILQEWGFESRMPHLVFERRRRDHGSRPFVTDAGTGREYTYNGVGVLVDAVAAALADTGCRPGEVVAWIASPSIEAIAMWFGIARAGALDVSLGNALKGALLSQLMKDSQPRTIVVSADLLDSLYSFETDDLESVRAIICVGEATTTLPHAINGVQVVTADLSVADTSTRRHAKDSTVTEVSTLMYTSGTTGPSRAVMMSHHHLFFIGASFVEQFDIDEESVLFHYSPFNHLTGRQLVLAAILANCRLVMTSGFSPATFWTDINSSGCTHVVMVGSAVPILLNDSQCTEVPTLTHVWAVPAMPAAHKEIATRYGVTVYVPYGATEIGIVTMPRPGAVAPPDNCGQVSEFFEIAVLDSHDAVLPWGSLGEIAVRPRMGHTIFSGYWQSPEATNEACRNLWYHTRDFGSLTADGFLIFADRKEGFLRSRGENVSSAEVERIVESLTDISECAVIGRESEEGDSDLVAVLVAARGAQLDPLKLLRELAALLPHYMVPTVFWVTGALPRTRTGKVEKYQLRQQLGSADVWDARRAGLRVSRRGVVDRFGSLV